MPTFAERLYELRQAKGLTQKQLAEQSGLNLWTVRGYEQGRRDPSWQAALKMARVLGVPMESFADCDEVSGGRPSKAAARPGPAGKKRSPRK